MHLTGKTTEMVFLRQATAGICLPSTSHRSDPTGDARSRQYPSGCENVRRGPPLARVNKCLGARDTDWFQRERLFSRFDEGCLLDEEGWYSITPG